MAFTYNYRVMKIITYNINGIRAGLKKGLLDWLKAENPDVLCLQEIKLLETELVEDFFTALGYHCYWHPAQKKGYSGVATFSKLKATDHQVGVGEFYFDAEGRVLITHFENFSIINTYFPSGSSGDERQAYKMQFLDFYLPFLDNFKQNNPNVILCGDVNICHTEIDIHNPVANKNTSGFLPDERAWIGKLIDSGFIDSFRHFNKQPHHYTWWTYRAGAKAKNLGWRIDYLFASQALEKNLVSSTIHNEIVFSDHCPVSLKLNLSSSYE